MKFGIYVHIPYCLQRCTYCDFATYEHTKILPPIQYFQLLKREVDHLHAHFPKGELYSLYFGGGTPSLVDAELIVDFIQHLANRGFKTGPGTEVTIEINPATLMEEKLNTYLKLGFNRFSVGAQTFNDKLLKSVKREHNAKDTRETLSILKSKGLNYSFDLLFALPGYTMEDLRLDLAEVIKFSPPHISPYCLTVPEGHALYKQLLTDDLQIEMFELISKTLRENGYHRYEISNFAKPGFESRHNSLYWQDQPYWGVGLSSHSYLTPALAAQSGAQHGLRFWNFKSIQTYQDWIEKTVSLAAPDATFLKKLPEENYEVLEQHQYLTDFCHTSLRTRAGLDIEKVKKKFGAGIAEKIESIAKGQAELGMLKIATTGPSPAYILTDEGVVVSNQVFSVFTFLKGEL